MGPLFFGYDVTHWWQTFFGIAASQSILLYYLHTSLSTFYTLAFNCFFKLPVSVYACNTKLRPLKDSTREEILLKSIAVRKVNQRPKLCQLQQLITDVTASCKDLCSIKCITRAVRLFTSCLYKAAENGYKCLLYPDSYIKTPKRTIPQVVEACDPTTFNWVTSSSKSKKAEKF